MIAACGPAAKKYGVSENMHPDDLLFWSTRAPEKFNPGQAFDVICVISFFTHLAGETWGRWLRCISRFLKPGGILVFTAHGRASVSIPAMKAMSITMESVPADGFLFPVSDHRASKPRAGPACLGGRAHAIRQPRRR
jgi:SAM-dependent methyltransferase